MEERTFSPGDQLGHHQLIEKIGEGGQGEVWRARDSRFERDVAIKILPAKALADPGARERFRREARAVGRLNHPNIATAHDFGDDPVEYLVTEYVAGSGLDEQLSGGALPEEAVVAFGLQLAAGLEAAHRQGIIHRDLKPGNLRVTQGGTLKILDFGLAQIFDPSADAASAETVTINMTLTGTLPYMAPEQFAGISDQRSDVWSAGAVLYEMATGQLMFPEAKIHEVRDAILNSRPRPPRAVNPRLSSGLEQIILHCIEKKPEDRYQTAAELRQELQRLAEGRRTVLRQQQQARRFAVAALVVILAATALVMAHYWPQILQKIGQGPHGAAAPFRLMAILPVDATGQSASDSALVRGMAETISAHLSRATQGQVLQLIPPSELISRGAKTSDAAHREFGVERVLEVSVQRSGDRVRVTCSLIDPNTHRILNACTVTGDNNDLFALQDSLVGEVIAMLPADARSPETSPTVVHAAQPAAYEFYLKGRGYLMEYQKPENLDAAIAEFQRALAVSPNYAPAYAGLGEAYWRGYEAHRGKNWLDTATNNCEKALEADAQLAAAHTCLGNIYNDTGRYEKAVDEFKRALALDKSIPQTLNGLGKAYTRLNRVGEAESTYKSAISTWPQYWAVYNWLGQFYFMQARYADAAVMFRKVTELQPDNQNGYSNLGGVLLLEGEYREATEALNRSVQLQPTLQAYSNLGTAYFYERRYADAIGAYEKARGLNDKYFMNWGNLGDALYWSQSRRPEADAAYKKAILLAASELKTNPRDADTRAFMAQYSAMVGDKAAATAELQQALHLAPADPDVLFRAALVYNQFGDRQQALNWLEKAAKAGFSRTTIRDTPDFDRLKTDPAFVTLLSGK